MEKRKLQEEMIILHQKLDGIIQKRLGDQKSLKDREEIFFEDILSFRAEIYKKTY